LNRAWFCGLARQIYDYDHEIYWVNNFVINDEIKRNKIKGLKKKKKKPGARSRPSGPAHLGL
jgi:hypothetical protein